MVAFDVIEAFDIQWLEFLLHKNDEELDEINICD